MDKVISFIKSPKGIISIIFFIVIILFLVLGSIFHIAFIYRLGLSLFLIMVLIIILLYTRMKEVQKASQIEKSISTESDSDMQGLSPEKREEIEQFKKQLESAIESLKNSKLAKGKRGKAALYALPWYMFIGPPAAGKTTAIQNSGLEFPFGKEGFRGVGGTRNCDWFFSTKAIFLDTAGRYVSESEDRPEWIAFLDTLKKNRKRKPVNGVIVSINIDEIINSDKDRLYDHARNIRKRVDELIENLGVNFPVYFMFTKCDLIQGFVEYFGDFSETERSQIWGATLTPMQQSDPAIKEVFRDEYKKLENKLFEIRTIRLSGPLKREQRRKVFLFPFQFQSLQSKLTYLIGEVFQSNPYQDNPIFRGFYFTSGTQEGAPLDLAIREIAKQFNLTETAGEEEDEIIETKNYFIKDLLNDVVIGDQNYAAGQTTGASKRINFYKTLTISASAAALFLFCLFTLIGYNGSSSLLKRISNTSVSFNRINWNGDLLTTFSKSDSLRSLITEIRNGTADKSFVGFGMDRSERLLVPLKQLYFARTENFFTQNIYDEIVKGLNNYANGQDYSGEEVYDYLKCYLLLGKERKRLDSLQYRTLNKEFSWILTSKFLNPIPPSAQKDSLRHLFNYYTSFLARGLEDKNVYPVKNDNLLINLVRNRIQFKPNPQTIYARIKQNGIGKYSNDLTLEQAIGGRFLTVMKTDSKIPYIFTDGGWNDFMKGAINDESRNPGRDDWVLGNKNYNAANSNSFSGPQMKKDLLNLYAADYEQTWIQFIQSIRFGNFGSVPLAASNMKLLSDPVNSPLILLLKVFSGQLQTIAGVLGQDSLQQNKSPKFSQISQTNSVINDIGKFQKFIDGSQGGQNSDLNAVIAQYGAINGVLESIKGGQDLTKDYAVKVLTQRAVEFPTAMQVIRGATFDIQSVQSVFTEPVKLSWNAILSDAEQYLNTEWKAKIADPFNANMANSFPFKQVANGVPIQDFTNFFKPQDGTLWSFFNSELSPFISKGNWTVNQWEGSGLDFSRSFKNMLRAAESISNTLFSNGNMSISFRLKPQLPDSKIINGKKPIVEQIYLNLDGTENYYQMGAPFWTDYTWPGNKGTPGVRMNISIHDYGTSDTKTFDGEWALFRLIKDASISEAGSSSQYRLTWNFKKENLYNVNVSYMLHTYSSKNPFSSGFFSSFNIPNKLD